MKHLNAFVPRPNGPRQGSRDVCTLKPGSAVSIVMNIHDSINVLSDMKLFHIPALVIIRGDHLKPFPWQQSRGYEVCTLVGAAFV